MSTTTLLEDLKDHISSVALTQTPGLTFRIHTFSDADLGGAAPVLLLRRSGTGGGDDNIAQQTDVDVVVLVAPGLVKSGENLCHTLREFLKGDAGFSTAEAYAYVVYSPIVGPVQLSNGKHRFMFMVRCFTENQ